MRNLTKKIPTVVPTEKDQRMGLQGRRRPWAPTSRCIYGPYPSNPGPKNMAVAEVSGCSQT